MRTEQQDQPSDLQATYVGGVARLEVPLHSVVTLRRIAEELRGLAMNLDYLSRHRDPPAEVLLAARFAVERAGKRMKQIRGKGRPKKVVPRWRGPNDY